MYPLQIRLKTFFLMASGRRDRKRDSSDLDSCVITVAKEKTGISLKELHCCIERYIIFSRFDYGKNRNLVDVYFCFINGVE